MKAPCKTCLDPQKKIYRETEWLCRGCYTLRINQNAFRRIVADFRPASDYNCKLFALYAKKIGSSYIKNSELPVARRWACFLSLTPVKPFKSWLEVSALSQQLKIRHGNHKVRGCPVLNTARLLADGGDLPQVSEDADFQILQLMKKFSANDRMVMNEFKKEVLNNHLSFHSTIKVLRALHVYSKCLSDSETLLVNSEKSARSFFELNPNGVLETNEKLKIFNSFYKWALITGYANQNPFKNVVPDLLVRMCSACKKTVRFAASETLCNDCYVDSRYRSKINVLMKSFTPASPYNAKLMELYLKYIRRYRLKTDHHRTTKVFKNFLESEKIPTLKSWLDVALLSNRFLKSNQILQYGCPIIKIGRVLQELGVLAVREEEDFDLYLKREIDEWRDFNRDLVTQYASYMKKSRRKSQSAVYALMILKSLSGWLNKNSGSPDLLLVTDVVARNYTEHLLSTGKYKINVDVCSKFYRWARDRKLILANPFEGFHSPKRTSVIKICSDSDARKLYAFMKRKDSDPELALIVTLVFCFGFKARDLAWASTELNDSGVLKIILKDSAPSYGRKHPYREKILTLPSDPPWFMDLQRRYARAWRNRFAATVKDFPGQPLILNRQGRNNRPLRTLAIYKRFYKATLVATDRKIPLSLIRRTGAHFYAARGDASALSTMGWSKDYSFDFTWAPRHIVTGK